MKALIDSDIFQHEFGNATDSEGRPLSWPLVQARVQGRIDSIMEATGADSYQLYITADDKSNFRYKIATIKPYKGTRPSEKPKWYYHIRNFLVDHRGAIEVHGMEADDAITIDQCNSIDACKHMSLSGKTFEETVICTRDKDLDMVPGWHYTWSAGSQKERPLWFQTELGGLKCFYKQLLTGDTVDNIPGLYGVGKSSASLKHVDACNTELEMFELVFNEYKKRYGNYAEMFFRENAQLLWMLREPGEVWQPPERESIEGIETEEGNLTEEVKE